MNKTLLATCLAASTLAMAFPASAQDATADAQQLRASLLTLVKALVDQNTLTVAKASEMLRQAGIDPALLNAPSTPAVAAVAAPPAPPVVRVPYVPEAVKRELREEIRQEVMATARAERWGVPEALPAWLARFNFSGDIRLRYQLDDFADENGNQLLSTFDTFYQQPLNGTSNVTDDRGRFRWRARLAIGARVADEVQAGLRLVTNRGGDANDPASTNVDAGQFNRRYGTGFDLAHLSWGLGPYSVVGGRMANPYRTTDLLWSNDLTLDGVAASWQPTFGYEWTGFATAGLHPLREVNNSPRNRAKDSWLLGLQTGAQWRPGTGWNVRGGLGLFDFRNIEGRLNPAVMGSTDFDETAPLVRTRGNTMFIINAEVPPTPGVTATPLYGIASKFRVLDLNLAAEYTTPELWRFGVAGNVLNNVGWDRDEILARMGGAAGNAATGLPGTTGCAPGPSRLDCRRTQGYRVEFTLGRGATEEQGSWLMSVGTRYLERDAVPDGFTPGDYRLGGTDVKATSIGGSYSVARNTQFGLRYVQAQSIDLPFAFRVNTWTFDLNAKF